MGRFQSAFSYWSQYRVKCDQWPIAVPVADLSRMAAMGWPAFSGHAAHQIKGEISSIIALALPIEERSRHESAPRFVPRILCK
jgi:hypothetical protein